MILSEYAEYYKDLKFSKFSPSKESDYDNRISIRSFSGKMTKARYKALSKICRANTWHSRCSHEWDCCGCKYAQSMEFDYKYNLVTVTLQESFNY